MKTWQAGNGAVVHRLLGGRGNAYLIVAGNRTCMVDTGRASGLKTLLNRLRANGFETVDYLVLTHAHYDHAENAADLKKHFDLKIFIHQSEAPFLEKGDNSAIAGTIAPTRFLVSLVRSRMQQLLHYPPVTPDFFVDKELHLAPFGLDATILPTPGHTKGSVSVVVGDIALTGDAIFGVWPGSVFPPFGQDIPRMVESWRILADTGCRTFLPGHGFERSRDLLIEQYRKFTERRG